MGALSFPPRRTATAFGIANTQFHEAHTVRGRFMPSLKRIKVVVAVTVFICFAGFGQCQEASSPKLRRGEEAIPLWDYLYRQGVKLDCYFTIEEMTQEEGGDDWITEHEVQAGNDPSSIEKMIEQLSAQLKGVHIYRSKENPAVVHFIDERLEKEKEYSLPKCVTIKFRGTPVELVEKLQRTSFENLHPKMGGVFSGGIGGYDFTTKIYCSTGGASVRRVLTDWLPLSHYTRTLWIAETQRTDGKLETGVDHLGGQHGDGKVDLSPYEGQETRDDIDYESGAPKFNGVIPFDYGQIAYYNNPDRDKEKLHVNLVSQAITFIDERLKADKPLQVRWAMFYLGKRKAKEGVPVLLKYLDYHYTTCGILEESYPAVRALTQIGQPAADAAFDELVGKDQSNLRVRLLA